MRVCYFSIASKKFFNTICTQKKPSLLQNPKSLVGDKEDYVVDYVYLSSVKKPQFKICAWPP